MNKENLTKKISVIVPTYNEEENVTELTKRLDAVFEVAGAKYEIIFIDDHSTDKTAKLIKDLAKNYPVALFFKQGKKGKAYSLLEGFARAKYPILAMIDADLQYPPEAIIPMAQKLDKGADIVVANRINQETSLSRRILSRGFSLLFSRWLHELHCDVQSGLKVFSHKVSKEVRIDPSPWTFDLEFLLKARNYGYRIASHGIVFAERKNGESKIVFWKAIWEIGFNAVKLKLRKMKPLHLDPETGESMAGAGVAHGRKRFVTHTTLRHNFSAIDTFTVMQNAVLYGSLVILIVAMLLNPMQTAIVVVAGLSFIYFIDVFFNLFLVLRSLKTPPELSSTQEELESLQDKELPVYSILCPLYREARILPGFVEAINNLEWPKEKLDVLLLLEENDQETIDVARAMDLPEAFRIVVVPHSMPKTKPKACNYGLCFARGEYVVIYDAEDIPDTKQLKKAYLGFQKSPKNVRCLQAKLNYFNPQHNMLTRLFTAEYSLWFDISLPGLQSVNTSIPLGGTSNHFRAKDLLELEGWDPFNVTEDCDLGVRIFKRGYRTAIIDSVTLEEANSQFFSWLKQRSRWIKGYMQTYLVHMREPFKFFRENGIHAFLFQLVVGGKLAFIFINPFLWLATIAYFAWYDRVGLFIESLYPDPVFYMAVTSLVLGNFLAMYYYMLGCAKRGHWSLVKYVFLVPFYWIMVSIAGFIALYQLFVKPHYWEKTEHGLHLKKRKSFISRVDGIFQGFRPKRKMTEAIPAGAIIEAKIEKVETGIQNSEPVNASTGNKLKVKKTESIFASKKFFKKWYKMLVSPEGIFMQILLFSNFLNFAFNAYLGRMLTFENLALVTIINTLWYIATIFAYPLGTTINRQVSQLSVSQDKSAGLGFFYFVLKKSVFWVVTISLLWIVFSPLTSSFFKVEDPLALPLFSLAIISGVAMISFYSFLQGNLFFVSAGAISLLESFSKLALAVLFVSLGAFRWVHLSIPLSLFFSALFGIFLLSRKKIKPKKQEKFSFPRKFFGASFLNNISIAIFLSLDIVLVKHFFSPELAGQYALISLVGKMIFFLGSMPNMFTVTFVGRAIGSKQDPAKILAMILGSTTAIVAIGFLVLGIFGGVTIPMLFGEKAQSIVAYLPVYVFAMVSFTLANVLVTYHLAKKNYFFNVLLFFVSLGMVAGIIFLHQSIKDIVWVVFLFSTAGFLIISFFHIFENKFKFLKRGIRDFLDVFFGNLPDAQTKNALGKSILIFNWRDTKHVYAGGAEVYVQQIAKIWVAQGNHVTLFCGSDGKQTRYEKIDGIDIVRRGGFYLVYFWAFFYYIFRFRGKYDVIVDCQNGVPFFTPLYAKEPVFCLMHHVHQEVFFRHLAKPLAMFASFLEKDLMPLVYRKIKFITVSQSSKNEMTKIGLGEAGVQIIHNGVQLDEYVVGERAECPTVLYLGRLKAYKSVDILLRAFCQVLEKQPEAELIIAGTGDAERYLKDLSVSLGFNDQRVIFKGRVTEEDKINLLQKAWVLVNPSLMEGWGIVVIEANACGTPVIASDVPGLRDSVKAAESGYLVPYGDVDGFAREILNIIEDNQLREKMSLDARAWAENFAWGESSVSFLSFITD